MDAYELGRAQVIMDKARLNFTVRVGTHWHIGWETLERLGHPDVLLGLQVKRDFGRPDRLTMCSMGLTP